MNRRQEQNEQSREKIINGALDEFGRNDYFTASTNSICKNNGISKGLLFHYYVSKDELFMVCVKKCFDELSKHIEEHLHESVGTMEEMLCEYIQCRIEFFKLQPYYKKIFHTAVFNAPQHLVLDIEESRKILNEVNELFLAKVLDNLELKKEVNKDEVISISIDFANYLLLKYKLHGTEEDNFMEESSKEFIQMMKMLFYGIVQGN
ncbi:MAG: TetR/AcrR family transcriptional regulator [Clostridium sp.]|uniref:TetR/AcrR family transcriptional regulator n=1 Tax=Clostridium sp. TaxID=1506 RepID=UPI003051E7A9